MTAVLKDKRVLVTGATGFIGSHAVEALTEAGATLTVVYRDQKTLKRLTPSLRNAAVLWDLRTPPTVEIKKAIAHCDTLVHCAGEVIRQPRRDDERLPDDSCFALHMVQALPEGCRQVVYVSSTAVYGDIQRAHEDSPTEPAAIYGVVRLMTEYSLGLYGRETGKIISILRVPSVYGPRMQKARAIPSFMRSLVDGDAICLEQGAFQSNNYVHVSDLAQAIVTSVKKAKSANGIFNVAARSETTLVDILDILERLTGLKAHRHAVDGPSASSGRPSHVSTSKALSQLGFKARRSLADGLDELFAYVRQER